MATTLAEYAKLSNDVLLKGVVETIIKDSPILQKMPFIEIVGNGLTYNRENAITAAAFYAVDGDWASPPAVTFDQLTAVLKILGQDADVDNYVRATRQNVQEDYAKAERHYRALQTDRPEGYVAVKPVPQAGIPMSRLLGALTSSIKQLEARIAELESLSRT